MAAERPADTHWNAPTERDRLDLQVKTILSQLNYPKCQEIPSSREQRRAANLSDHARPVFSNVALRATPTLQLVGPAYVLTYGEQ
jgi:hypothetical protein